MAKKTSDRDGVQIRWHQFINGVEADPALQSFFQRHHGVGEEPRTLFEAVGEDLASSREDKREQAFWILVAGMPELADLLHERETRQPGWRSGTGKGQQVIDRGMDIVSYLYRKLVEEHEFKTKEVKDPRPYVRKAARNWKTDEWRKESRLVSLDEPLSDEGMTLGSSLAASLPDPTSVEDEVVNELYYEHGLQQIQTWNFLQDEELGWFTETYAAKRPLESVAAQYDIPSKEATRVRQRISRARRKALKRLESILSLYLMTFILNNIKTADAFDFWVTRSSPHCHSFVFSAEGVDAFDLLRLGKNHSDSWLWEWIQCAVDHGQKNEGLIYKNPWMVVRSLTHKFDGSPSHFFLLSWRNSKDTLLRDSRFHKAYLFEDIFKMWWDSRCSPGYSFRDVFMYSGLPRDFATSEKVPPLGIPSLEDAINEVLRAESTPTIIYDPFNVLSW